MSDPSLFARLDVNVAQGASIRHAEGLSWIADLVFHVLLVFFLGDGLSTARALDFRIGDAFLPG